VVLLLLDTYRNVTQGDNMNRTTALVASAAIIAAGIASVGTASFAGNHNAQHKVTPGPHQYKYQLPATSGADAAAYTFPGLSPAIYNASYSLSAFMTDATATLSCQFERPLPNPTDYQLPEYGASGGFNYSTVSVNGALDLRHNGPVGLVCFASSGTFRLDHSSHHSSVTFLKMGSTVVRDGRRAAKSANPSAIHSPLAR
jgi:hypothetical protein